jgi:hypothetical protein
MPCGTWLVTNLDFDSNKLKKGLKCKITKVRGPKW